MFDFFRKKAKGSNADDKLKNAKLELDEQKKKKRAETKEKCIVNAMEKTGWTRDYAVAQISDARKRLGITYKDYDRYEFCKIPESQQEQEYKNILERKERLKKQKEKNIESIMSKTGWSREHTIEKVEAAREKVGITYKNYNKYDFFKIPENDQERKYQEIESKNERRERKARKNEKLLHSVMEATGWDYDYAKSKMNKSKEVCGAEYKDYYAYKFWEIDDDQQKTYFTKGMANALRRKYNTSKENVACFMNKNQFNEVFNECLGRPWAYNNDISLADFKERFKNEKKIIYKPLSASCGSGVAAYEINDDNIDTVYYQLKALPTGVVEGYIIQHHEMSKYSRKSVNTIRVVSVYDGNEVNLLYAAFRMGGGDAIVDNFHNGGVLALIDLKNGEVITDAIDLSGKMYEKHPTTNEKIKGFVIPYWDEIVDMIKKAGKIVDGVGYVGWDVAVTETGPVLIEGNTAPAPNVLQLPYAKEHRGMAHVIEKYL